MNKGTEYELKAMKLVHQKLNNKELGIIPESAKIQHKPEYYSRDRQADIIFDVSIEVYRKEVEQKVENAQIVWIWECKNYSDKVPVDDVEEFHSKLNQIGADNTKGTIISPVGFQKSAFEFARSNGIGLWKWIPGNLPVIHLDSSTYNPWSEDTIKQTIMYGLTEAISHGYQGDNFIYGLTTQGQLITKVSELITLELRDFDNEKNG